MFDSCTSRSELCNFFPSWPIGRRQSIVVVLSIILFTIATNLLEHLIPWREQVVRNGSRERVRAQVDVLNVWHLPKDLWYVALELVGADVQICEIRHVSQHHWQGAPNLVGSKLQNSELGKFPYCVRNASFDRIVAQLQLLKVAQVADAIWNGSLQLPRGLGPIECNHRTSIRSVGGVAPVFGILAAPELIVTGFGLVIVLFIWRPPHLFPDLLCNVAVMMTILHWHQKVLARRGCCLCGLLSLCCCRRRCGGGRGTISFFFTEHVSQVSKILGIHGLIEFWRKISICDDFGLIHLSQGSNWRVDQDQQRQPVPRHTGHDFATQDCSCNEPLEPKWL
mmetsp:Transcript_23908/g.43870  ORF Transcript_23908/g.43870 Transcript_23908/m.43870 type:complete len:337 (+) Transcript_23908:135-1145(+)